VAAVALVVLLVASPVQAIIPDPVETGLLAKIAAVLQAIQEFRMQVMARLQEQVNTRINAYAFPTRLFGAIRTTATTVVDIRRELQRLACDWPSLPRTAPLRDMLLRRTQFCRAGFQGVWGSHEGFWDGPLQETNDYVATMTANMISERTERTNTSWVRAHRDLFDEHTILRSSPGEANRAEAAALAWANEVAVGNSQMATQQLLVRQMARDLERFDLKKAADATYYTYRGLTTLAGREWRVAPPDPTEEIR
jgi:hypothetical protein